MSNILTGFNMQGNDPIDDRIVSKSNLETLEQYLKRVPVQKRYYGLTFFALDKNNELRKYTFQTSLINPTIDDNEEEIERIDKELQEHVSNKAIHKTSEEIRSEIVDADIPDTIARVQWTLDQINTAVINLIGGASDEYNTLKRIQTKIEELRAKIYGDDGGTVLKTLEQALKFLNQYKDFIVDIPENFVNKQDIVDNLTTDDPTKVLSAKQGKVLSDTLTNYFESAMQSIRTETDRAINAENRIETKLDKEIDRSIKEDQRIDAKLDAEIKRSTDEDLRIDSKLDSEINRSTTEDDRLDKKIDAETTRATDAESNLNTKIETETDRAEGEESRIEEKLDNEITRSTNKDTEHDNRLQALEGQTHEQNTDLGTTNSTFQLKYNTGNKIKHESDAISVRNAADTDYVNFIAKNATFKGDLLVEGQSFVTEAETVEIKDNLLLLNKGEVGAGVTKGIAGLEIDRGTEPNYFIIFDESDNRFKAGVEGDLWNLALRESDDNMLDGYFISWNSKDKVLSTTNIVNESTPLLFGRTDYKQYSGNRTDPDGNYSSYAFISEAEGNHLYNFSGSSNWNIDTDKINFRFWKPLLGTTFKRASDNSEVLYHADIVNNLTSGGTNKVLSAEQGKLLQNSITSIQGSYLPLTGGTMTGAINSTSYNNILSIDGNPLISYQSGDKCVNIGGYRLNSKIFFLTSQSDLLHYRKDEGSLTGTSYRIYDAYNLPDPARLGVDQTFTGLNTFTKKTIIGNEVSPQILLDPANQIRYRYAAPEISRGYTIALGDNDNIREFTFGGYYSASKNEEYAYLSLPGQAWDASTYKFYADTLKVPYEWSIKGPDGHAIIWSQTSKIVNLGRARGTTKVRSGSTDLIHTKGSTEYIIWDKSNLPNPASATDLANYLPLTGGTMTGAINFTSYNNILSIDGNPLISYQSGDKCVNIGGYRLNSKIFFLTSQSDLLHYRKDEGSLTGTSYRIYDAYNLPDPARLGVDQTFTGLNTFTKKTIIGNEVSPQILLDPANQIRYRYAAPEISRGYTIALGDNDNIREFTFGGYYSASKNEEYAYLSLPGQAWDASTYKFYADTLKVPYEWSIKGPDGHAIIWSQTSKIVNLGRARGTTKVRSGSTDLIHTKGSTEYIIWDKSNLPNPASATDLANYLPLTGGTMKGDIRFPIGNGIVCNDITGTAAYVILRTWNANNSTRMYVGTVNFPTYISSTASDLIHDRNGSSYLLWDTYNLTNPVTYTTDAYNYATLRNKDGQYFTYIKAGTNGLLPHSQATLANGGAGLLGTSDWSFNAAYINNLYTNRIMFSNNTWTNDLVPNRTYGGYLQVLDAYNAGTAEAGGPTNYGTVLQVNSRNAHWANQLWFPGGAVASKNGLYYRHMSYNETTYGEWHRLLTNKDVNILSASYNNNPNSLPINQIFYAKTQGVAGTPTSSGLLFSVQGDDEGIQLWAGANRTELYYRTKWTSFGNWIKLATTSDIGNYLPLTGGTLSGTLTIDTVGSTPLVINNNDTNVPETFMRVLRKGTASAAIGFRDSLGAYIYNYNSKKYLFIDNDGYARVGTTNGSTRLALITDISTVSGCLPLSGGTLTGALTMNSRKNNAVIDVVGGTGNNWNGGAGALSVQVPGDEGQTPLLLARRSGATINTTTLSERLLDMALLDTGTIFRVGMSGVNALELEVTSFTNKVGIGKLFGKQIATTDQIPSIPSISISNSGSGNAVTAISASGHTLTVTKGATYLTSHQTIYDLTFQAGTFSAKTFDPNGAAATVNIPTNTSHLTNDSGFITSSALNGYATQSWCNSKFAPLTNFTLTSNYATIKGNGNEICIGNTSQSSASAYMSINYRVPTGCTYAPNAFYFRAGSAESWANIYAGNVYMSSNLVATQTWSSGQFPTKTGTGASGTWGISITGNATTATTASKLGSTTIGGSAKPIYLSSGKPTACSATVGSATVPVYMNAGTITQCSTTLGVSITGNAATATNATQLGGTAASSYVKANDNISRLTNDSGYTTQEWVNGQGFLTSDSILDKFVPTTGGYIRNSDQVLLRLQRTGVSTGTSRTIEMYFDDSNTDGTSTTPRGSIGYNSEVGMFLYSAASEKFLAMESTGRPFYGTPENRYYLLGSNTQYHSLDGYQRIGDIMIQWGYFSVQGNSKRTVNFTVSFTNTVWSVTGSWDNTATGGQENWGFADYTSSGFTIINGDGSSRVFHYIAIGPFTRS